MNAEHVRDYLLANHAAARKTWPSGLVQVAIYCTSYGHGVAPRLSFKVYGNGENVQGESEASLEVAMQRALASADPKTQAAAIRQQIAALEQEARALEGQ